MREAIQTVPKHQWFRPIVICLTKCTYFGQSQQVPTRYQICKVFKYYFEKMKREQKKIEREKDKKNAREQGAQGENVKGAGERTPLTEPLHRQADNLIFLGVNYPWPYSQWAYSAYILGSPGLLWSAELAKIGPSAHMKIQLANSFRIGLFVKHLNPCLTNNLITVLIPSIYLPKCAIVFNYHEYEMYHFE